MSGRVRVAIAGVGNCASSLVQGVEYYRNADPADDVPGLMHVVLGGYHVGDVEFVAAFDVDAAKVGLDLGKAIFASQNNTIRFANVGGLGVQVQRAPTFDGLGQYYREIIEESPAPPVDVAQLLRDTRTEVLVSYLPVGSEEAQRYYANACLEAGVVFVNVIPVFIASDPEWAERFADAGIPIVGDDIKSQVGATITHRVLARLMEDRGMAIDRTYQLNFGGNMDFKNMLERTRLESKKKSKTQSVTSQIEQGIESDNVHIGPSDHVPWLDDRKWAYIRLEGRNFGDVPLNIELKLEVWDSPNSAGVIIDAVRCCKVALDRGVGGVLAGPSAYFMKSPVVQYHDEQAREMVEAFIRDEENVADLLYSPDGPGEHELRLVGDVAGKRVLDLGCGDGNAAVTLAEQGAVVIAVDTSEARLALGRRRGEEAEVRLDWRAGDLADLAFLRADSIDLVFSAFAIDTVDDPARVFRQVQRVLKPNAPFVFSQAHPFTLCIDDAQLVRPYLDAGPVTVTRWGEPATLYPRSLSESFADLSRAGFRVDTLLELPAPTHPPSVPATVVWRARKEGT